MKKIFNYLRSMRFGILLLALIGICSVVGTVIPQGREIAWYAQNYRSFHAVILLLPNGRQAVLVMTTATPDNKQAEACMNEVARAVYEALL